MKNHQDNANALPALLHAAGGVDTPETNSLCCVAAGIIAPSSATAEALIPHEKLRGAALADATLNAQERPLAQPVVGYSQASGNLDAVAKGEQLLAPTIVLGTQDQNDFTTIHNAEETLRSAQLGLSKAIQSAFPVGSKLRVSIGHMELTVAVTSHSQIWWRRPDEFYAKNVETGKRQIFSHHQVLEVLS
ncbi:hypothetical protein [Pseudomonas carnis]|uniref:hypothetical protein n=1 Tax=Pseudomonas TaxID=286 RepID=UPI0039AFDF9D